MRLLCCLVLASAICTVPAQSLAANIPIDGTPPVMQGFVFSVDNQQVGNCGAFHIIANGQGTINETIYFDNYGDPFRLSVQARYRGTLTNSVTGFSVADEPSVIHIFIDFNRLTETHVGQFFNINVPGEGTVALEVGRYVVDPTGNISFIHGQFDVSDGGLDVLCSALN